MTRKIKWICHEHVEPATIRQVKQLAGLYERLELMKMFRTFGSK